MRTNRKLIVLGLLFAATGIAAQGRQTGGYVIYRIGEKLPDEMFTDEHIIKDSSHYHVRKAPDGYEWLRGVDGHVLLVSKSSHILNRMELRPNIPPESR